MRTCQRKKIPEALLRKPSLLAHNLLITILHVLQDQHQESIVGRTGHRLLLELFSLFLQPSSFQSLGDPANDGKGVPILPFRSRISPTNLSMSAAQASALICIP
jgi:hypothetical protein